MSRSRAFALAFLALGAGAFAGCGTDRIDPPGDDELGDTEVTIAVDSLSAWSRRAREQWSEPDTARSREAAALARATFAGVWVDRQAAHDDAARAREAEHLPSSKEVAPPSPEEVSEALRGLGLAADVVVAQGPVPLWQVVLRDPTGAAHAATEFWAWPDPKAPLGEPVLQPLPADAPARRRFGPDAVGTLATWERSDGAGLASAWTRPRGSGGLEVAILRRGRAGTKAGATWRVTDTRLLPVLADSVAFVGPARGEAAPSLVVFGAGARDPLFDACPSCPRLARRQRYALVEKTWTLREERTEPTPYAAVVSFMHALRDGGTEAAVPYAAGPEVLAQAQELGLERGPVTPLRAAPGTGATDRTQRYRRGGSGGSDGLEITLAPRGDGWVVADLRPTRLVIE